MNPYIVPGLKNKSMKSTGWKDSFEKIIDTVIKDTGISVDQVMGRGRKREIVELRHVSIWAITRTTGASLKSIGEYFNRDHSTVIHSRDTINNLIDSRNQSVLRIVEKIKEFM